MKRKYSKNLPLDSETRNSQTPSSSYTESSAPIIKNMTSISQRHIKTPQYKIFLILIFGVISTHVESLRFELQSGHSKCIAEELKKDSMTVGKYHIVNQTEGYPLPDSHRVTVRVTSTKGTNYHYSDNVAEGNFVFHAGEEGDYVTCFFAADHKPPVTLTIELEWKSGIVAKEWSNVAKKGSVELMELELKKMFDMVQSIHDEMSYLRAREEEVREINTSTASKMVWLSFLSLGICLSVAGLQFWHLKSYFQKKKLI